jgi:hypothetical protein
MINIPEKLQFLLGLKLIGLLEPLGRGDILIEDIRVTNDFKFRKQLLTPDFMEAVGGLEAQAILTDDALIYGEWNPECNCTHEACLHQLSRLLHWVGLFLNALWLVKDNSITFELGFIQLKSPGKMPAWFSNFLAQTVQMADGTKTKVVFTRSELRKGREIFRDVLLPLSLTGDEEVKGPKSFAIFGPINVANATVPRLKRAFYFLSGARANRDLGMKVAMYCSLLESLFSTDSNEITHKISHRISIFLTDHVKNRCDLYNRVKRAYGIRSKVVHGDALGSDASKNITEVSRDIDDICRRLLMKIISDVSLIHQFNADKKSLDDYFLRSSFGDTSVMPSTHAPASSSKK